MLDQQQQETPEEIDPAAEQKMVQNVLDALLQDDEPHEPKVRHHHAYLRGPVLSSSSSLHPPTCISTLVSTISLPPNLSVSHKLT